MFESFLKFARKTTVIANKIYSFFFITLFRLAVMCKFCFLFCKLLFTEPGKPSKIPIFAVKKTSKVDISNKVKLIYIYSGFNEKPVKLWCYLYGLLWGYVTDFNKIKLN